MLRAALCLALLLAPLLAWPHATGLGTVQVMADSSSVDYQVKLSAHDLAIAIGIETDLVAPVPRADFEARDDVLRQYVSARLQVTADDQPCNAQPLVVTYTGLPENVALALRFDCPPSARWLRIGYLLLFDVDVGHRAVGALQAGRSSREFLFDAQVTDLEFELAQPPAPWLSRAGRIAWLGVVHIAGGLDHVLFVLCLLLGARRFADLLATVTAFTLAHSLTLGLAWWRIIELPAQVVESAIAVSVIVAAGANLVRRSATRWPIAFTFGLVHGLGFYVVLDALQLEGSGLVTTLFAFNLGVELGQVAIVGLLWPLLLAGRRWPRYEIALRLVSLLIMLAGAAMLWQRIGA